MPDSLKTLPISFVFVYKDEVEKCVYSDSAVNTLDVYSTVCHQFFPLCFKK
jgi:hypothetical protein